MSSRPVFDGSVPLTIQDRIVELCLRFKQACQNQTPARLEEFLSEMEEVYRPLLLRELVTCEITMRRQSGEAPALAVKALRSALVGHPAMVRRFEEEAQLIGQLQHPCIPPVHEMDTLGDTVTTRVTPSRAQE